jgi:hypothetical protein
MYASILLLLPKPNIVNHHYCYLVTLYHSTLVKKVWRFKFGEESCFDFAQHSSVYGLVIETRFCLLVPDPNLNCRCCTSNSCQGARLCAPSQSAAMTVQFGMTSE